MYLSFDFSMKYNHCYKQIKDYFWREKWHWDIFGEFEILAIFLKKKKDDLRSKCIPFFQFQVVLSSVAYEMYVMEEFLLDDMRGREGRSQG